VAEKLPAHRMEMAVFSTAGFAGAVVGHFIAPKTVTAALAWSGSPAALVPALAIALVILGGLLGLDAIVTGMILAAALPHPEAFGVHPVILGSAVVLLPVSLKLAVVRRSIFPGTPAPAFPGRH
jgi:hypothetical protein